MVIPDHSGPARALGSMGVNQRLRLYLEAVERFGGHVFCPTSPGNPASDPEQESAVLLRLARFRMGNNGFQSSMRKNQRPQRITSMSFSAGARPVHKLMAGGLLAHLVLSLARNTTLPGKWPRVAASRAASGPIEA